MVTGAVVGASVYYARVMDSSSEPWAVVANAIVEEAEFRYAIPLMIAAALLIVRAPRAVAIGVALTVSCVLFATMPGHLDQISRGIDIAPFLAFAVLTSLVALRTRSLLPGVLAHTLCNLCTLPVAIGAAAPALRMGGVVVGLIGLVLGAELANRRRARDEQLGALARIDVVDLDFEARVGVLFEG